MNELISVVIPVYNAAPFLEACINSIISQTYDNWEVILVNDGSKDDSLTICKKFEANSKKIIVVDQSNKGVSAARRNGVSHSSGKWIFFVDADDIVPSDALEKLIRYGEKFDIVIGQVCFNGPYVWPYPVIDTELERKDYIRDILFGKKIHCGPVAKIIRKDLFDESVFAIPRKIRNGEDLLMNLRLAQNVTCVKVVRDVVYDYIYRDGSADTRNSFVSMSYTIMFIGYVLQSMKLKNIIQQLPFLLWNACGLILSCGKRKVKLFLKR